MPAARDMRRALHWLGVGIVIVSLFYIGWWVVQHFDKVLSLEWSSRTITVTVFSTIVYTCSLVALAVSWTVIAFAALPDRKKLIAAIRIYARAGIAKYLPGNVLHMVGRQVLGRTLGISQGRIAVATGAEIAVSLLSVWLIVAAVFTVLPGPMSRGLSVLTLAVGALAAIAFVRPSLLLWVAPWTASILDRLAGGARSQEFGLALALNLAFFLCLALIAGSVFRALAGEALPLMQVGAVYLSAWLAGYIVPGASGGLGVREAALLVLLDGAAREPTVLAFALAMRLQNIVGDLLFFAATFALPVCAAAAAETCQSARPADRDPSA
jgi:hypothetical protein